MIAAGRREVLLPWDFAAVAAAPGSLTRPKGPDEYHRYCRALNTG